MSAVSPRLFSMPQDALTTNDYYTPAWVFDRMGITFDLDVCAPPGGVPWIPADRFYTQADDGLASPWSGRVWMNPPFSCIAPWADRFIQHRHGVALLPFSKGHWFTRVWDDPDVPIAIGPNRFEFVNGSGFGIFGRMVFIAFGDECVDAISRLGVVRRIA